MKKMLILILSIAMIISSYPGSAILAADESESNVLEEEYTTISDPALLNYLESTIYDQLIEDLGSDDYFIENVSAVYISQEYLEELAYNSQSNIYFGYTLAELDEEFQGSRYVFTLGDDGQTTVKELEEIKDDTFNQVIRNVAIGGGVILICVTVSVATGGVAPAVSAIFAASAKTGAVMALSSGAISGATAGIVKGIETHNIDEAMKAAAVAGSEGFKWGAISGALVGGASEAIALKGATLNGLTMDQAAIIQKESKYPLDVIKEFQSMEQYQICKDGGIFPEMLNGKTALLRKIDLNQVDEFGRTNIQRIAENLSPLDPNGIPYELHHIGQKVDSTLAILTRSEHRLGGMDKIWHQVVEPGTGVHSQISDALWSQQKQAFWKAYVAKFAGVVL